MEQCPDSPVQAAANGGAKSSLKAWPGPLAPPSPAERSASPGGTPQVRFKIAAAAPARPKRGRRRTASSSSHLSDSTSPDDECVTLERHAPDGGWGWVVVVAAFTINMIADGICFSFGVFFVEFLRYFGASKSTTSWLGSIFLALPLLLGPVASSLVDRFGCRRTTVAGALLSAAGFMLSYFADSMELLFFTFSVMPGIGLSLCYVSAVVIVAYYFERRRSLATGISVCGTGVGTFLFPPLVELLIQEYGWRGALLVLSGIFLNIAVCGMLMRDLDWTKHKNRERSSQCTLSADGDSDSLRSEAESLPDIEQLRTALHSGDVSALLGRPVSSEQLERLHSSALQLPTWLADADAPPEVLKTIETNRRLHELVSRLYPHLLLPAGEEGTLPENGTGPGATVRTTRSVPHQPHRAAPRPLFTCEPEPPAACLRNMRLRRQSMTYRGAMLNIHRYRLRASSCPDIYRNSMITILSEDEDEGCWSCVRDVLRVLQKMLDVSFFRLPAFTLFALSNFVLYMFYDVPYVYLADHAISGGATDEEASVLISVIGISNVVGVPRK
ncbi:uncharacterized protein LOC119113452 [Pollicipes pollicipes]|uniref:uncharacterized protein LOC119113452 n=1 Tax=Pollicipes pollicipes TaxID=41117 RepID=UPI001885A261|nr:uncharacterized protein LOC119113452 [Pollicipes pollicipes]